MSTLIDEIRADLLELKESYHVMLGLERQRLAHQAGYCRGRGWCDLAAQFDEAGKGDDLAVMMEQANALIKLVMERICDVSREDWLERCADSQEETVTRLEVTQEVIDEARAEEAKEIQEYRRKMTDKLIHDQVWPMKGNVTGVTGEDLSDKTDPADQADLSDEQKGGEL